jgi:hypothetical protein
VNHPLLTKWLADCLPVTSEFYTRAELARDTIADSDPDIADRLERALDVCSFCGKDRGFVGHVQTDYPEMRGHPYQPLVTP